MTIMDRLIKLRMENIKPFFDLTVSSNPKDPSYSVLRLRQPPWLLNKEIYQTPGSDLVAKKLITIVASFMNTSSKTFKEEASEIFDVEKKIGLVS